MHNAVGKARGERAFLSTHGQNGRERAGHAALSHVPIELVRVGRPRALPRGAVARLHVVDVRCRTVDRHHPAVHHAARVVQLPAQAACVQRVLPQPVPAVAKVLGARLRELAALGLVGFHALAALAHQRARSGLVLGLLLKEGRLDRPAPFAHVPQRLGHAHESLAHVDAKLVKLGLHRLGVVPVRLGRVVQDRLAHALHLGHVGRVVVDAALRVGVQVRVDRVDAHLL